MRTALLDLLRCPHCGDELTLTDAVLEGGEVVRGVLFDHCAAYPVVEGIAYLRGDAAGEQALARLGAPGHEAWACLVGAELPGAGRPAPAASCRQALAALVPGPEGDHLLHRFSDPVFRAGEHLFRALAQARSPSGRVLDVGAGAGHLTRSVQPFASATVVADVSFRKIWLARRYVAPEADAVCCDGNRVLPFVSGAFDLVLSCDAFHYVWSRQLLAAELRRVRAADGVLALAHLHNLLVHNASAGMPLSPAGYRRLLGPDARLLAEDDLLDRALAGADLDVGGRSDEALAGAAALAALVPGAGLPEQLLAAPEPAAVRLQVNPLYRRTAHDRWTLTPPSPLWAQEYGEALRSLPHEVELPEALLRGGGDLQGRAAGLRRSRVLLDLPDRYV